MFVSTNLIMFVVDQLTLSHVGINHVVGLDGRNYKIFLKIMLISDMNLEFLFKEFENMKKRNIQRS